MALALAGPNAVADWRTLLGPTKAYRAKWEQPDCLRAMYGLGDTRNGFHGSGECVRLDSGAEMGGGRAPISADPLPPHCSSPVVDVPDNPSPLPGPGSVEEAKHELGLVFEGFAVDAWLAFEEARRLESSATSSTARLGESGGGGG